MEMARITAVLLLLPVLVGDDVVGPVEYTKKGVRLDGRTTSWKKLSSLTETDPDGEAIRAEHEKRAKKAGESAAAWAALGEWARERGLEKRAKEAFERAVELDGDNAKARQGLAFARTKDGWEPAGEILKAKKKDLDGNDRKARIELADWCREHSLFAEEWKILVGLIVEDGWDKSAIRRIRTRLEGRAPKVELGPPLEGRWLAVEDKTKHHQLKVWAIFALDFVGVDEDGKLFSGGGKKLSDYHGFGSPVYAAADGTVTHVEDKYPDMAPGKGGKFGEANTVTIQHAEEEYTDYGHLKQGSAAVKTGEKVKKGDLIGRVGNSGASGLPHLHFTMMMPVHDEQGRGGWIGVPFRMEGFRLVRAFRTACDVEVRRARPQEGWVMVFPKPK